MFERIDKSYDKDSLQTPKYIINWLDSVYHFDIDLAASKDNHHFKEYFTKEDDAISIDWSEYGRSGFCNPPYSRGNIDPFIEKAMEQSEKGFTTVMLIPELNGEHRTRDILKESTNIYHFDTRIWFIHPVTGAECKNNNRGSIVVEFTKKYRRTDANHIYHELDGIKTEYD